MITVITDGTQSHRVLLSADHLRQIQEDPRKAHSLLASMCARDDGASDVTSAPKVPTTEELRAAGCIMESPADGAGSSVQTPAAVAGPSSSQQTETPQSANVWSEGETRLLLDGYSKYLSQVGPMKRFRNKKTMWTQLSKDLADTLNSSKTWEQCMKLRAHDEMANVDDAEEKNSKNLPHTHPNQEPEQQINSPYP
ncbi:uncharacterized protein ISCGN_012719 [Ixodes scapularis]